MPILHSPSSSGVMAKFWFTTFSVQGSSIRYIFDMFSVQWRESISLKKTTLYITDLHEIMPSHILVLLTCLSPLTQWKGNLKCSQIGDFKEDGGSCNSGFAPVMLLWADTLLHLQYVIVRGPCRCPSRISIITHGFCLWLPLTLRWVFCVLHIGIMHPFGTPPILY